MAFPTPEGWDDFPQAMYVFAKKPPPDSNIKDPVTMTPEEIKLYLPKALGLTSICFGPQGFLTAVVMGCDPGESDDDWRENFRKFMYNDRIDNRLVSWFDVFKKTKVLKFSKESGKAIAYRNLVVHFEGKVIDFKKKFGKGNDYKAAAKFILDLAPKWRNNIHRIYDYDEGAIVEAMKKRAKKSFQPLDEIPEIARVGDESSDSEREKQEAKEGKDCHQRLRKKFENVGVFLQLLLENNENTF